MTVLNNHALGVGGRIGVISAQPHVNANFGFVRNRANSWMHWAQFHSRHMFEFMTWKDATAYAGRGPNDFDGLTTYASGYDDGVIGQSLASVFARRNYLAYNAPCDIVVIDVGREHIGTETKEQIQSIREQLADHYLSFGKTVILFPILPGPTSLWASGSANRLAGHWINHQSKNFAKKRKNCHFFKVPWHWIDETDVDAQPRAGMLDPANPLLLSTAGAQRLGEAFSYFLMDLCPVGLYDVVSRVPATRDDKFSGSNNPFGNVMPNSLFVQSGGSVSAGFTGEAPSGYVIQRMSGASTGEASLSERYGHGNWLQLDITPVGSGNNDAFILGYVSSVIARPLNPGAWMQASLEMQIDVGGVPLKRMNLTLSNGSSGNPTTSSALYPHTSGGQNMPVDNVWLEGTLVTPPVEIVSDGFALTWLFEFWIDAAAGVANGGYLNMRLGKPELRQIEDPRTMAGFIPPTAA